MKIQISKRSLNQRVMRYLAKQGLVLRKTYEGNWFAVDKAKESIVNINVDLLKIATDNKLIKAYEEVV